jgi:hypothetical protein
MLEMSYREAVSAQQKAAKQTRIWHEEGLLVGLHFPDLFTCCSAIIQKRISTHQDIVESAKALAKNILLEYKLSTASREHLQDAFINSQRVSEMAVNTLSSCSTSIDWTESFRCLALIESHDERRQVSKWDLYYQPASYHNFALGGKPSHPIFGLDSTLDFVLDLLRRLQEKETSVIVIILSNGVRSESISHR